MIDGRVERPSGHHGLDIGRLATVSQGDQLIDVLDEQNDNMNDYSDKQITMNANTIAA